jgi:hypothetical protein
VEGHNLYFIFKIRNKCLILNIKCKLCGGAQVWGLTVLCKHVERKQEMVDEKTAVFLNMMQSLMHNISTERLE